MIIALSATWGIMIAVSICYVACEKDLSWKQKLGIVSAAILLPITLPVGLLAIGYFSCNSKENIKDSFNSAINSIQSCCDATESCCKLVEENVGETINVISNSGISFPNSPYYSNESSKLLGADKNNMHYVCAVENGRFK